MKSQIKKIAYPVMLAFTFFGYYINTASATALTNPIPSVTDLRDLINNLLNWMMGFIGVIAVVYLMYAGFKYVTAGGDSKKAQEAKEGITQAIIGIAIAVIGYLLVSLVFTVLGVDKNVSKNAGL